MATRKAKTGTAIVPWKQAMAEAAKAQVTVEKTTASFQSIGTRNGILSVDDTPIKGNEIRVVVVMSAHENQLYPGRYNPDIKQIPSCFAFSEPEGPEDDMRPHEDSSDPQNADCASCPMNEMGTADTGRGKACKNIRRLAVITEDALEDPAALEEAEVRLLKVPVTSVKNWSKYVHRLSEEMQTPAWGVVTTISIAPDAKTQFKILFSFENEIEFDQELFDAMERKRAEVAKEITLPYTEPPVEEAPVRGRKGAAAKAAQKPAPQKPAPQKRGAAAKPAPRRASKY